MSFPRYFRLSILSASCLTLLMTRQAFAYVDPGTGSYILQIILASIVGASFTIKLFGKKIYFFFSRLFSRNNNSGNDKPSDDD